MSVAVCVGVDICDRAEFLLRLLFRRVRVLFRTLSSITLDSNKILFVSIQFSAHNTILPQSPTKRKHQLTLRSPPRAPSISPHRHRLLVVNNIIEVCQGALELPAIDCLSGFAGVFEGDAEVGAVGAGGLARCYARGCVADLVRDDLSVPVSDLVS